MSYKKFIVISPVLLLTLYLNTTEAKANISEETVIHKQENNSSFKNEELNIVTPSNNTNLGKSSTKESEPKNNILTHEKSILPNKNLKVSKIINTETTNNTSNKLTDTDGDGLYDKDEKTGEENTWNISSRDMVMFSKLSYKDDTFVSKVLDDSSYPTESPDNFKYAMMNEELAPHWKIKETFHFSSGFDSILFETKNKLNSKNNIHILAFRGTDEISDIDDDIALSVGANPKQAKDAENLIDRLSLIPSIKNLYLTGHSLGGYLSQRAHTHAVKKGYDFVQQTYTFNSPKVKGNIFNKDVKHSAEIMDKLTKEGKAIHYIADNDQIIPIVGAVTGSINTGYNKGGHISDGFFREKFNEFSGFTIGYRNDISATKYIFSKIPHTAKKIVNTGKATGVIINRSKIAKPKTTRRNLRINLFAASGKIILKK